MSNEMVRREMVRELELIIALKGMGFDTVDLTCHIGVHPGRPFDSWSAKATKPLTHRGVRLRSGAGATRLRALHDLVLRATEGERAQAPSHLALVPPPEPSEAG